MTRRTRDKVPAPFYMQPRGLAKFSASKEETSWAVTARTVYYVVPVADNLTKTKATKLAAALNSEVLLAVTTSSKVYL